MKPCYEYIELMNAILDGEASPAQEAALTDHLAQCTACAALYEDLKALKSGSEALITKAPERLKANVMASISAETAAKTTNVIPFPRKKKAPNRWRSFAAMAAVFALVIGVGANQGLLFGGTSSAPAPSAAPAAAEALPQEARDMTKQDAAAYSRTEELDEVRSVIPSALFDEEKAKGTLAENSNSTMESSATPSFAPAEPSVTPAPSDQRLALELVVDRIYGESGCTVERVFTGSEVCAVRLLDGETVVDEGVVTFSGLSPNGKFYTFSWSWAEQSSEEARLYRYAVPTDLRYVMWAGDSLGVDAFDAALKD